MPPPESSPPPPPPPAPGEPPEGDLTRFLDKFRAGGWTTRDLFEHTHERFRLLASQMLGYFPGLRGELETGDVLNQAYLDIERALNAKAAKLADEDTPDGQLVNGSDHLLLLVSRVMRHKLIDLARRRKHKPSPDPQLDQLPGASGAPDDQAQLVEFHEAVEGLEDDLRQVVELIVYHGLTQADAARVLDISERTVRRRWLQAGLHLGPHLTGGGGA